MAQLELLSLSAHFDEVKAVQDISIRMEQREFRGLIGPDGASKTTVFSAITGVVQLTAGDVYSKGQRLNEIRADKIVHMRTMRTFQNIRVYPKMTVTENVAVELNSHPSYNVLSVMLRLPHVIKRDREIRRLSLEYLDEVGILEYKNYETGALLYGLQRRLEIARVLATKPKLLFLDEPAARMSTGESIKPISFPKDLHQNNDGLTIVLIEHHPEVVMEVYQNIDVLNLGTILASGTPDEIQKNSDVIRVYLGERRKRNGR